jgi:hypothetical protein
MAEKSTGIKTTGADTYVATQQAAEQAEGQSRVVQIISMTAGKIETGISRLGVSSNDAMDVTSVSGSLVAGDNMYLACYVNHSQSNGSCLVTPLLCDNDGVVLGYLDPKVSSVKVPVINVTNYLSVCLSWEVMSTGAWKLFPLVSELSDGNSVDVYAYTF